LVLPALLWAEPADARPHPCRCGSKFRVCLLRLFRRPSITGGRGG
jgi:hypothetical protein